MADCSPTQRFAYLGFPHLGGTFTVYRHLRDGLARAGVEVRWLCIGAERAFCDPAWAGEKSRGQVVGPDEDYGNRRDATLAIVHALEKGGYDGVFVNVLTSPAEMSAVRYLRTEMLRIMIVHNITPGTYAAARSIREHVHVTIGVSPRIRNDLVQRHGFSLRRDPQRYRPVYAHQGFATAALDGAVAAALPRTHRGCRERCILAAENPEAPGSGDFTVCRGGRPGSA